MKIDWDLSHLYKNNNEWIKDFKKLTEKIKKLKKLNNSFINNSNSFCDFITLKIATDILIEKIYCYARRHLDIDSTLIDYKKMLEDALKLYSDIQIINNQFENTLIQNSTLVHEYLKEEKLRKYQRYVYLILRKKDHIILNNDLPKYTNNILKIKNEYQSLFSTDIKFESVILDGKMKEINRTNYNNLILDKKQGNRKTIFDTYTDAYKQANNILSSLYISKLKNDIKISKLENYNNLLEKKLFELELPSEILNNLINAINKNLHVMHKYTDLKKKISGLDEYHIYDSTASVCEVPKIQLNLNESILIIKNSLKILDEDYIQIIDKIFNEGWIDVYPKKNKRTMSFTCISYVGVPYILINYDGLINSVRTLAHEIGHAAHVHYSKTNNSFEYFEFSYFLTEIASKVNEILVNEYMIKNCKTCDERKYILNNIISSIGNSIFGQIMLTEFENTIINKLSNDEFIDNTYLNELYFELSKKYNGPSLEYDENLKYGWSKIPHFIMQDTYYLYQYSIGTGIATNIAYRILDNEKEIISKYKKFLSLGNSVSIEEALAIINIDLKNNKYMTDTIKLLNKKINEMIKLY